LGVQVSTGEGRRTVTDEPSLKKDQILHPRGRGKCWAERGRGYGKGTRRRMNDPAAADASKKNAETLSLNRLRGFGGDTPKLLKDWPAESRGVKKKKPVQKCSVLSLLKKRAEDREGGMTRKKTIRVRGAKRKITRKEKR